MALESVGPLVVGVDGSLSRIQNWSLMNQTERDAAFRLLGKRNKARLSKLRQEQPDSEDSRENANMEAQEGSPILALPPSESTNDI